MATDLPLTSRTVVFWKFKPDSPVIFSHGKSVSPPTGFEQVRLTFDWLYTAHVLRLCPEGGPHPADTTRKEKSVQIAEGSVRKASGFPPAGEVEKLCSATV